MGGRRARGEATGSANFQSRMAPFGSPTKYAGAACPPDAWTTLTPAGKRRPDLERLDPWALGGGSGHPVGVDRDRTDRGGAEQECLGSGEADRDEIAIRTRRFTGCASRSADGSPS